jgi:DNA-binding MarR family transcriptional regulator
MKDEIKNECYLLSLEGYEYTEISKKLNISRATVSRAISSIEKGNDYQLAVKSCGVLTSLYVRYQDWIKKKLRELNDLTAEDNNQKLAIIKLENELLKDMITIGASGDFINSVRKLRDKLGELEAGPDVKQG